MSTFVHMCDFERVIKNPAFTTENRVFRGVTPVRLERTANGLKVPCCQVELEID